jgi:dimeric dUTPase (all-alpha-NTP-PPase superfamily)
MNINDIKQEAEMPDNIWKAIFDHQWQLALKYKEIENMGDLLTPESLASNLDTKQGQRWIKDFAWRTTEELTESDEALSIKVKAEREQDYALANEALSHVVEELIDALHFLTELTLIAGFDHAIVPEVPVDEDTDQLYSSYNVIYQLGLMCNCLKNKPWKQTQMLTDRPKAEAYLRGAWAALIRMLHYRTDDLGIYQFYFKKNAVNQFRIRSKY